VTLLRYEFDWDPNKERTNIRKHGIAFRQAATVFRDPNQLSIFDKSHSDKEDRWVIIGIDSVGILRVVVHTFRKFDENLWQIRIISARKANSDETRQYNEIPK
jgi:uncharacterized DUF497 family protein